MREIRLFVYGTLKQGFENHLPYCRNAMVIEPAVCLGVLYDTGAGYPAMQPSCSCENIVRGEIITIPEADLGAIDALEEVPVLYRRIETDCCLDSGTTVKAWCYIMDELPEHSTYIATGYWA